MMARNLTITACLVPTTGPSCEDTKGVWHKLPDLSRFPLLGNCEYALAYRVIPLKDMPANPRLRVVVELDIAMDGMIQAVRQNGAAVQSATVRVLLGRKYNLRWETLPIKPGYRASASILEAAFELPSKLVVLAGRRSSLMTSAAAVMPPGWALLRGGAPVCFAR